MFRSTTIFKELHILAKVNIIYLNTVVCIPSAVVWQHICNIIILFYVSMLKVSNYWIFIYR